MKSSAKRLLLDWVPPGAVRAGKGLLDRVRPARFEFVGTGWPAGVSPAVAWDSEGVAAARERSWSAFLASLEGVGPFGISPEDLAAPWHLDVERQTLYLTFGYALALAAAERGTAPDEDRPTAADRHVGAPAGHPIVSVLDWGGELGTYHEVAKRLLPGTGFDYHCVDLPSVTALGRRLNSEVTFHDDDAWRGRSYDLVFSSSSLQYLPDWRRTVESLVGCSTGWVYITRMPFVQRAGSFVALQRVPEYRTSYHGWVLNRDEFVAAVEAAGARLIREFVNHAGPRIKGAPEQNAYMGFLFRRT